MSKSFNDWVRPHARRFADRGLTPNAISTVRIVLSPLVPVAYLYTGLLGTTGLVAFLAFTDLLDGWLARLLGMESALGKMLDAIGDWALSFPVVLLLLFLGVIPLHPYTWQPWCLALILARNVSITFVVVLQRERSDSIKRPEYARWMSGLLIVSLSMLLVSRSWPILHQVGELCLVASTVFAMISWWQYFRYFKKA